MFVNKMPRYEILSEDAMATLDKGWRRIVSELGIEFMKPEALELFRAGRLEIGEGTLLEPNVWLTGGEVGRIRIGEGVFHGAFGSVGEFTQHKPG